MSKTGFVLSLFWISVATTSLAQSPFHSARPAAGQSVYNDTPYAQEYSLRYYLPDSGRSTSLQSLSVNRDGQIRVLSDAGLIVPDNGSLFFPGKFVTDISYPAIISKRINAISTYHGQTIYLDSQQVFSNAWAGRIQIQHGLPGARMFAGGQDFHFLISDGEHLEYLDTASNKLWSGSFNGLTQIRFIETTGSFLLLSHEAVAEWMPGQPINILYKGSEISCAAYSSARKSIIVGTSKGYLVLRDRTSLRQHPVDEHDSLFIRNVPCPMIACIEEIGGELWFGSVRGAYHLHRNGKFSYYAGQRWLPDNQVISIARDPDSNILVLTRKGLAELCEKKMTLEDKALFFEKQVREKNIRYGFNCSVVKLTESYASAQTGNQPSDNLWTGMYLVSQLFRYKVTGSLAARENAYESFEALERLHTVTGIRGLFARSFERDYKIENAKDSGWQQKELLSGAPASVWLSAADHHNWTWRSTASSDQTVGQIFALTAILECVDDKSWKARALKCLDDLMGYIVEHNLYIIDVDGQPTMWGKWNPDYVNSFPRNVGDRKITSSNIIAFLQTAYRFTHKEKYKTAAYNLMNRFGYLDNLMRPMSAIGPDDKNDLNKALSESWNHSDDEMYFLAYWGLYPYAFTHDLQEKYRRTIKDHWAIERPERNALWNFTYAMTGAGDFDLAPSIRFLKDYPLDLRNWAVHNSDRADLQMLPANFRRQTTRELLPLQEVPLYRHNGNIFQLDSEGDGKSLISAGDTWLLPYWMGRFLGVISGPVQKHSNR